MRPNGDQRFAISEQEHAVVANVRLETLRLDFEFTDEGILLLLGNLGHMSL
jgi:hypothetical protein